MIDFLERMKRLNICANAFILVIELTEIYFLKKAPFRILSEFILGEGCNGLSGSMAGNIRGGDRF